MQVQTLRDEWKPVAEGEASGDEHNPVRVRLHRCWSWLDQVEAMSEEDAGMADARLIYSWIAFNSLYAVWEPYTHEPKPDRRSFQLFTDRIVGYDRETIVGDFLHAQRDLVRAIVADEYLCDYFWEDPSDEGMARKANSESRGLNAMYLASRYTSIIDFVLERVYLARCQLVHGAATHGSRLNRTAVDRCGAFLFPFVCVMSRVLIRDAWREDWGELCYPPIDRQR